MRFVVALTAGGCGSSDGGGSGGAPIALEDFIPTLIDNSCTRLAACGQVPDKATCVAASAINLDELFASVRAGTTTYNGAAAGKCLTATRQGLAAVACTGSAQVTVRTDPSCAEIFKGTLAEGAACSRAEQCLSASCSISTCDGTPQCCVGTCAPATTPVPIGGDCSDSASQCVVGSLCRLTTHVCVAEPGIGQPCDVSTGEFCELGFACVSGVCGRLPAEGEACSSGCDAIGNFCDPATSKCAPKIALGGPCSPSGPGDSCVDYAFCDSSSATCVARPKAGEACGSSVQGTCLLSLMCTTAGTCALPEPGPVCP